MYIFMVLISAIILGVYEFLKKLSLKQSSPLETLFFYCLSGFVFSLIFIKSALDFSFNQVMFILLKSLIIVLDWFLVLKSMDKLDVGIVVPFSLLSTILIVFGSHFFFNEPITWLHFLSLLFIGGGIIALTFLNPDKGKRKNQYKYLVLLTIASVLGGTSGLLDKYMLNVKNMKAQGILVWFLFFNAIIYGVLYFIKNKKIDFKKLKYNYWLILTGLAIILSDLFYYKAITLEGAQLSIISIVRKFNVIVATILASIFLKEKDLIKKLVILIFMLIGISLPIIF